MLGKHRQSIFGDVAVFLPHFSFMTTQIERDALAKAKRNSDLGIAGRAQAEPMTKEEGDAYLGLMRKYRTNKLAELIKLAK